MKNLFDYIAVLALAVVLTLWVRNPSSPALAAFILVLVGVQLLVIILARRSEEDVMSTYIKEKGRPSWDSWNFYL